jgi:hypothetical protein
MVAEALRGKPLVPLDKLEVNNIHSFGGCVVLADAARRHGLPALLAPLSPRSGALIQAMIFGGLLFPPSVAPFYVESRTARLAVVCGLDPEKERFEFADLAAALRELDENWPKVSALLTRPHAEVRAITLLRTSGSAAQAAVGALGMDADGIPVPLVSENAEAAEVGLQGLLQQIAGHSKAGLPLLILDEETAAGLNVERLEKQPYLFELAQESLGALLRQLNPAQLQHALRSGGTVEVRHHGERYILAPMNDLRDTEAQEARVRTGSLKETPGATAARSSEPAAASSKSGNGGNGGNGGGGGGTLAPGVLRGVTTNVPSERLTAATAIEWTNRARATRAAFSPVQIVVGQPPSGEGLIAWRNHQNLQFLTHRLRCHLHAEWRARGETRPVEEVLRDLQEVHRATLTVDGVVMRRLATHPSKAVAALLTKLNLWELFEWGENGRK